MSLPLPIYKSLSLMPSNAPRAVVAEVEAEEAAVEVEEEAQYPLQDHPRQHRDSMSQHHKEM